MEKQFLSPSDVQFPNVLAPSVISHVVKVSGARDTIYVSGQVSTDENGEVIGVGDLETQIHQVFKNLKKVLASAGATLEHVVLLNAFMTDIQQIDVFRTLRRQYLDNDRPPAITTVGVTGLAGPGLLIEIAVFAEISPRRAGKTARQKRAKGAEQ
jgi:enamine deaminase RidA (YjgF/YER057c/UK114 family)